MNWDEWGEDPRDFEHLQETIEEEGISYDEAYNLVTKIGGKFPCPYCRSGVAEPWDGDKSIYFCNRENIPVNVTDIVDELLGY